MLPIYMVHVDATIHIYIYMAAKWYLTAEKNECWQTVVSPVCQYFFQIESYDFAASQHEIYSNQHAGYYYQNMLTSKKKYVDMQLINLCQHAIYFVDIQLIYVNI
jgi:hypothetical protein